MKKRVRIQMIAITKAEKDVIREKFPNVNIVRTMRQRSKRHRYYCEETKRVLKLLKQMREPDCAGDATWRNAANANRTTGNRV